MERNTRIICTMGPAVRNVEILRRLIQRGMNVARFNFSHGDHEYHKEGFALVREASRLEGVPVALLLDTKGPEIRTGLVPEGGQIELAAGARVTLMAEEDAQKLLGQKPVYCSPSFITVSYHQLADDVKVGAKILIADGLISLEVESIEDRKMLCRVLHGGTMGSKKNVNVVGVKTRLPAMTEKDEQDIAFGVQEGVDFIAASFIRRAQDVTTIQKYLASLGADIPVIAKIEDEEGLENIEEIIRVSYGIMIARGDLGVQIPVERLPLEQKRIIRLCNQVGKPVITATQMLESMIHNPRPTRAETTDVANAILDGTDCIMLSGETANGAYPDVAVEVMARIAQMVEQSREYQERLEWQRHSFAASDDIALAVAQAASSLADSINARAILVPTLRGNTARLVSHYRPGRKILAATPDSRIQRRLLVHWGVVPLLVHVEEDSELMIQQAMKAAIEGGFVTNSDRVVVVAGTPLNSPLMTNTIRVQVVGNILARGLNGFGGRCTGRIFKARTLEEASMTLRKGGGEILLTHTLDESFIPIIRVVSGIILEGVSELSWDIIKMVNPGIVYISQVADALNRIEDRLVVTLDGEEKLIYEGTL